MRTTKAHEDKNSMTQSQTTIRFAWTVIDCNLARTNRWNWNEPVPTCDLVKARGIFAFRHNNFQLNSGKKLAVPLGVRIHNYTFLLCLIGIKAIKIIGFLWCCCLKSVEGTRLDDLLVSAQFKKHRRSLVLAARRAGESICSHYACMHKWWKQTTRKHRTFAGLFYGSLVSLFVLYFYAWLVTFFRTKYVQYCKQRPVYEHIPFLGVTFSTRAPWENHSSVTQILKVPQVHSNLLSEISHGLLLHKHIIADEKIRFFPVYRPQQLMITMLMERAKCRTFNFLTHNKKTFHFQNKHFSRTRYRMKKMDFLGCFLRFLRKNHVRHDATSMRQVEGRPEIRHHVKSHNSALILMKHLLRYANWRTLQRCLIILKVLFICLFFVWPITLLAVSIVLTVA